MHMKNYTLILTAAISICIVSCGPAPEAGAPPTAGDVRVNELVKRTSGDWNALSPEEKAELTQQLGAGNEQTARMSFQSRNTAGGPPKPGG